jgi:diamine N-acetyltransferase
VTDQRLQVRRAGRSDAVMLHLIAAATFPLACEGTAQDDIQSHIDEYLTVERFREYAEDPVRRLLVAELDGTPAGYAMLVLEHSRNSEVLSLLKDVHAVELSRFYLLAGRHGDGYSDQLMNAAVQEARDAGASAVWLGVAEGNQRANTFYDRHEFVRRGSKIFMVGTTPLTDVIREKSL